MRRKVLISLIAIFSVLAATVQPAIAQQPADGNASVLFVYEEDNEKLMPWIDSFREELRASGIAFDECPAANASAADLSKYDTILVYGAVMAFASNEPVRDWLAKETRIAGKKVTLVVTANRWSLKKYHGQLVDLLDKKNAAIVDAVSSATKDLSEVERKTLVKKAVASAAR